MTVLPYVLNLNSCSSEQNNAKTYYSNSYIDSTCTSITSILGNCRQSRLEHKNEPINILQQHVRTYNVYSKVVQENSNYNIGIDNNDTCRNNWYQKQQI